MQPNQTLEALASTKPPQKTIYISGSPSGNACQHYRSVIAKSKKLCYEYCFPKIIGLTPEEAILLAVALDYENSTPDGTDGQIESPLLQDGLLEAGVEVRTVGMGGDVLRLLLVTSVEKNDAQMMMM